MTRVRIYNRPDLPIFEALEDPDASTQCPACAFGLATWRRFRHGRELPMARGVAALVEVLDRWTDGIHVFEPGTVRQIVLVDAITPIFACEDVDVATLEAMNAERRKAMS